MKITVASHPVVGLTCFHQYQNWTKKTLTIDMLYATMNAFNTTTTLSFHTTDSGQMAPIVSGLSPEAEFRAQKYIHQFTTGKIDFQTVSNYKPDVGLASSAAGFACLAGGLFRHLHPDRTLDLTEISKMARLGSFSAAAAVTGGISVIRRRGFTDEPYAEQIFTPEQLADVKIVVAISEVNKNSHDFYKEAQSSPFVEAARIAAEPLADQLIHAFESRDIDRLANLSEAHIMLNYGVLHTGENNKFLWKSNTIKAFSKIKQLRSNGEPIFASMNTGANVFAFCFSDSAVGKIVDYLDNQNIPSEVTKIGGELVISPGNDISSMPLADPSPMRRTG